MDGKAMSRSHFPGYDAQQQGGRKQPQKRQAHKRHPNLNLYDGDGRYPGNGVVPQNQDLGIPLLNNRSLSVLSTMHHLNPHRKVAMSPEILREAEEQASTLRRAVRQLQEQLEKANREKARIHRFLSDLLYTLNARGYESVRDHEGTFVDLNKCKGETYLDLRGRDLKQRVPVRRPGGHEYLLKAVIGNQERAIQSLVYKLESLGRDMVLGNRLNLEDNGLPRSPHETSKVACLEAEVLQLVNLIEGACHNCPDMYTALRDHYYKNEGTEASELSPRNPVIHNLLRKCEQIANDKESKQYQGTTEIALKVRSKTDYPRPLSEGCIKTVKTKNAQKAKLKGTKLTASAEIVSTARSSASQSPRESYEGNHLKPLNGNHRSDNRQPPQKSAVPRGAQIPPNAVPHITRSGGDSPSLIKGSTKSTLETYSKDCSVTTCPYCRSKFGLEESIADIKHHIEMHVFAGDATVI